MRMARRLIILNISVINYHNFVSDDLESILLFWISNVISVNVISGRWTLG